MEILASSERIVCELRIGCDILSFPDMHMCKYLQLKMAKLWCITVECYTYTNIFKKVIDDLGEF